MSAMYLLLFLELDKDSTYFCLIDLYSRCLYQNIISDFYSPAYRVVDNVLVNKRMTMEEMVNNSHIVEEKEPWETFRDTIKKVIKGTFLKKTSRTEQGNTRVPS